MSRFLQVVDPQGQAQIPDLETDVLTPEMFHQLSGKLACSRDEIYRATYIRNHHY